jgi:twitching motility protein PilT
MKPLIAKEIFKTAVEMGCSDIHIKAGSPPKARINGNLISLDDYPVLTAVNTRALIYDTMNQKAIATFQHQIYGIDYSLELPNIGRFRVNVAKGREAMALVARLLPESPKTLDDLGASPVLKKLAMTKTGIVIVSGPTGSGKSTTLSAMIDYINSNKSVNIISAEDPIEIIHNDKKSSIFQREIGSDVLDFASALKSALRQDPDVILIGEIRDLETMRTVLVAADTGHLVITTLHTNDTAETINRIITFYPPNERSEIRRALASSLRGVISQRLIPTIEKGRVGVNEILVNTPEIADIIIDETKSARDIKNIIAEDTKRGMITFEQALEKLVNTGVITLEEAIDNSINQDYFDNFVRQVPVKKQLPPQAHPYTNNPSPQQSPSTTRAVTPPHSTSNPNSGHPLSKRPPLPTRKH